MIRHLHLLMRLIPPQRNFKAVDQPRQQNLQLHGRHVLADACAGALAPHHHHLLHRGRAGVDGAAVGGDPAAWVKRLGVGEDGWVALRCVGLDGDESL